MLATILPVGQQALVLGSMQCLHCPAEGCNCRRVMNTLHRGTGCVCILASVSHPAV